MQGLASSEGERESSGALFGLDEDLWGLDETNRLRTT